MIRLYKANFSTGNQPVFWRVRDSTILEYYNPYGRKWALSRLRPEEALLSFTLVGTNVKFKV